MSKENCASLLALACLLCVSFFLGFGVGVETGRVNNQIQLVNSGVAEWRVNPKTGKTFFHLLPEPKK